ncbi:MAG: DUF2335 domain-containing protein [Bacteroidaceae bacterium]|nr:DUF2335 domain-containing protein [Bacteroidaceae bacterium]
MMSEKKDTPSKLPPVPEDASNELHSIIEHIENLPADDRDKIKAAIFTQIEQKSYSGPLPAPDDFAKYEQILPGATDRILKMAEAQVNHRIKTEETIVTNGLKQSRTGQWLGAILAALFVIVACILGLNGHDGLGGAIGVTTVIAVIVVFVLNKMPSFNKAEDN